MKKIITLCLVFSVTLLSENLFAKERKGAELIIKKTDGQKVRGELIAVKPDSFLLMDSQSGADVSVIIEDVTAITIIKKPNVGRGILVGGLICGGIGALVFLVGGPYEIDKATVVLGWGGICAAVGALIGAAIGATSGEEEIWIQGISDSEIKEILEKLRKKARIKRYQ